MKLRWMKKIEGETRLFPINPAACECEFSGIIAGPGGEPIACPAGHEAHTVQSLTDCRSGAAKSEWALALEQVEAAKLSTLRALFGKLADQAVRYGYGSRQAFRAAVEATRPSKFEVCELVSEHHGARVAAASAFVDAAAYLVDRADPENAEAVLAAEECGYEF